MNMLDRVADAIRLSTDFTQDIDWEDMEDWQKNPWREKAREVIKAMVVPSCGMINAGREQSEQPGWVWVAMLNAVLEGK